MRLRSFGVRLVALVAFGALAVGSNLGCTPTPEPTASPTPTPSPTPTENAVERQMRLDFEAAEKSYRTFRAELGRVLRAGGAKEATPVMKATASGEYLETFTRVVRGYRTTESHDTGKERIVYVRRGAHSPTSLHIDVCEDSRAVKSFERGVLTGSGELRTANLEVRKVNGVWKIWTGTGQKVKQCD